MTKLALACAAVAFCCLIAWASSSWIRGKVTAAQWDGTETLLCAGDQEMTLRGVKARLASGTLITAAGNCRLVLEGARLEGAAVLSVAGNAEVLVRNSVLNGEVGVAGDGILRVEGSELAGRVEIGGNAQVTVTGGQIHGTPVAVVVGGDGRAKISAKIDGAVKVEGHGRLEGTPELDQAQAARDLSDRVSRHACDGVLDCYAQANAFGNISGRLAVAIGSDGRATDAVYERGDAPASVRDCLMALGRRRHVEQVLDRPGRLLCDYVGSYLPSSRHLSFEPSFTQ